MQLAQRRLREYEADASSRPVSKQSTRGTTPVKASGSGTDSGAPHEAGQATPRPTASATPPRARASSARKQQQQPPQQSSVSGMDPRWLQEQVCSPCICPLSLPGLRTLFLSARADPAVRASQSPPLLPVARSISYEWICLAGRPGPIHSFAPSLEIAELACPPPLGGCHGPEAGGRGEARRAGQQGQVARTGEVSAATGPPDSRGQERRPEEAGPPDRC